MHIIIVSGHSILAPIYHMTQGKNQFTLTIKRKPNWYILILTGIWSVGWVGMIGTVVYGLSTDIDKIDAEIISFMTFYFLAGLFVVRTFLWHLRGHERVTLDNKELKIEKRGTILTRIRKFEVTEIEAFSLTEHPTTPRWIKLWGLSGGIVQFSYLGQNKYFGQTLNKNEATSIIDKLNHRLRTTNR